MPRFFGSSSVDKVNLSTAIVAKLTQARITAPVNQKLMLELTNAKLYGDLKILIKSLGESILKSNHDTTLPADEFIAKKNQFTRLVDTLAAEQAQLGEKLRLISFGMQLLQYYTLLCNDYFRSDFNFEEFAAFLAANKQLGDTSKNPFVVEYQLIKIYNELSTAVESATSKIAPMNAQEKINLIKTQLALLENTVRNFNESAPDNGFAAYLIFVTHYIYAKISELDYVLHESSLTTDEKLRLGDVQKAHLDLAKAHLSKIEELTAFHADYNRPLRGIEYSFGQDLLYKLPINNLDTVKEHLTALTQP